MTAAFDDLRGNGALRDKLIIAHNVAVDLMVSKLLLNGFESQAAQIEVLAAAVKSEHRKLIDDLNNEPRYQFGKDDIEARKVVRGSDEAFEVFCEMFDTSNLRDSLGNFCLRNKATLWFAIRPTVSNIKSHMELPKLPYGISFIDLIPTLNVDKMLMTGHGAAFIFRECIDPTIPEFRNLMVVSDLDNNLLHIKLVDVHLK